MIKKLTDVDREVVLDFLSSEPSFNLFAIGDIMNYGFEEEFIDVWGSFNKAGLLEGTLLRYYENFIPYFNNELSDLYEFKKIIIEYKGKKIISGKEEVVVNFNDVIQKNTIKSLYFCELKDNVNLTPITHEIKQANEDDVYRIYNFIEDIEEFNFTSTNSISKIRQVISSKLGRIFYIDNNENEIISVAQTTAENPYSAMIVGVATRIDERNKGLVSQCLSKLCSDLLKEEKVLCLFYDNPEAGKIYYRLGFKPIGKWMMIVES